MTQCSLQDQRHLFRGHYLFNSFLFNSHHASIIKPIKLAVKHSLLYKLKHHAQEGAERSIEIMITPSKAVAAASTKASE